MKKIFIIFSFLSLMTIFLVSCSGTTGSKGIQGDSGKDGNGIESIEKTNTNGLVDTYTITYTNGETTTFTVTNGSQGIQGIQGEAGNDGHTPVITIGENGNWFIDDIDTTKPSSIKGDTGNGISKIEKTGTDELVDTYTITFTNGDTTTFTVTNGSQGIQGIQGETGNDGHTPVITIGENGNWYIDDVDTTKSAEGLKGETGNGISNIEKTGTDELVDTYTITFTNGETTTFTVTNGSQGIQGIQGEAGNDGHTPVITIGENGNWYIDDVDTTKTAEGLKGETGNGISKIEKTSSEGLVDTYTITFTNGETTTFTVTNGSQGIQGIQGETGKDGHTPVITIGENGNWYIDDIDTTKPSYVKGDDGNGISKIEKTDTNGLVDTYTITFTNGETTTFEIVNGKAGESAYEIYLKYHPEYEGTEEEWINSLVAQSQTNIKYDVTFDSNGGTIVPAQNVNKGDKAYEPTKPTRVGYTFDGWYYDDIKWIFVGYTITDNITLKAKWVLNQYNLNITKNIEDVGTVIGSGTYDYDSEVSISATAKYGYLFEGWYQDNLLVSDKTSYKFNMPASDLVLEARWKIDEFADYTIIYNLNGGENSINNPATFKYSSSDIILESPNKDGYKFIGWTDNEITIPTLSYTISSGSMGDKEVTANYEIITYSITYNDSYNQSVTNVTEYNITNDTFSINSLNDQVGYAFKGWYSNNNELVTEVIKGSFGDLELTAVYELIEYNIIYQNCSDVGNDFYKFGDVEIALPSVEKEGFIFNGWYLFNNDGLKIEKLDQSLIVTNYDLVLSNNTEHEYAKMDITIYARWIAAVTSLTLSGQKTSFKTYDKFSFGGTVTANYGDDSTANVTSNAKITGYTMSKAGTQAITVSYTENDITKTATYNISINKAWRTIYNGKAHNIFAVTRDKITDYTVPGNISSHTEQIRISLTYSGMQYLTVTWSNGGSHATTEKYTTPTTINKTFTYDQGHDIAYFKISTSSSYPGGETGTMSWYQNGLWKGNVGSNIMASGIISVTKLEEYY